MAATLTPATTAAPLALALTVGPDSLVLAPHEPSGASWRKLRVPVARAAESGHVEVTVAQGAMRAAARMLKEAEVELAIEGSHLIATSVRTGRVAVLGDVPGVVAKPS